MVIIMTGIGYEINPTVNVIKPNVTSSTLRKVLKILG